MRKRRTKQEKASDRETAAALKLQPQLRALDSDHHGTAAERLETWARERLVVPSDRLGEKPFPLEPWQVEYLDGTLAKGVMEAGLSVARKNGKSGLIAVLLLGCMIGPLAHRGWRDLVCLMTGRLSLELLVAMEFIAQASGLTGVRCR